MDGTVLVADDDRTIRTVLTQALTRAGCRVHATGSMTTLMRWIGEGRGDLVISDVVMPDGNGLELLPAIAGQRPGLPVIMISAHNTIATAIQAVEKEAYDYLPKPFDLPDLMKRAARALKEKRVDPSPAPAAEEAGGDLPLVGATPSMQEMYRLVARVMNADLPVLVTGESGAGKSLVARAIHDYSDRRTLPFVVVGPDDVESPEGLAAAFARARGGSILFDEIGDFDARAQARIVRALDGALDGTLDGTLDGAGGGAGGEAPRILATSQAGLAGGMASGAVRQDLYYRLDGVTLAVPSLRERVEDIPLLARHFLARAERDGAPARRLSGEAADLLRAYSWPGNVRQLENAVRQLAAASAQEEIARQDVERALRGQPAMDLDLGGEADGLGASVARHLRRYFDLHGEVLPPPGLRGRILREVELPLIEAALDATGGNQARCADLLGINRNTLRTKIRDLDIRVTRRRKLM